GRLGPRGQCRHGQRDAAPRLPAVQDLPDLRSVPVNVFVTGGTGFVGAHLVRALQARGDRVTCLVRSPAKAAALGWRAVRIVRGDLDAADALREGDRKSTRLNSSHVAISYAVFCLKKKKQSQP